MFILDMEDSIVIKKPVDVVFNYMNDINREHEWQPYLREWHQTPDAEQNGVGTERRYVNQFMGRKIVNSYVTTEYEPNRRVMYKSTPEADVQATGGSVWEAFEGGTRVTFYFRPELGDFWGYIPKSIVRMIYGRTLSSNMRRLKKRIESWEESSDPN